MIGAIGMTLRRARIGGSVPDVFLVRGGWRTSLMRDIEHCAPDVLSMCMIVCVCVCVCVCMPEWVLRWLCGRCSVWRTYATRRPPRRTHDPERVEHRNVASGIVKLAALRLRVMVNDNIDIYMIDMRSVRCFER